MSVKRSMNSISDKNECQYDSFTLGDLVKRLRFMSNDHSKNTDNTEICEYQYEGQNVMKLPSNFSTTLFSLSGQEYANINVLIIGENCCNDCNVLSITGNTCTFR